MAGGTVRAAFLRETREHLGRPPDPRAVEAFRRGIVAGAAGYLDLDQFAELVESLKAPQQPRRVPLPIGKV